MAVRATILMPVLCGVDQAGAAPEQLHREDVRPAEYGDASIPGSLDAAQAEAQQSTLICRSQSSPPARSAMSSPARDGICMPGELTEIAIAAGLGDVDAVPIISSRIRKFRVTDEQIRDASTRCGCIMAERLGREARCCAPLTPTGCITNRRISSPVSAPANLTELRFNLVEMISGTRWARDAMPPPTTIAAE
jgi:hypothetical protein